MSKLMIDNHTACGLLRKLGVRNCLLNGGTLSFAMPEKDVFVSVQALALQADVRVSDMQVTVQEICVQNGGVEVTFSIGASNTEAETRPNGRRHE